MTTFAPTLLGQGTGDYAEFNLSDASQALVNTDGSNANGKFNAEFRATSTDLHWFFTEDTVMKTQGQFLATYNDPVDLGVVAPNLPAGADPGNVSRISEVDCQTADDPDGGDPVADIENDPDNVTPEADVQNSCSDSGVMESPFNPTRTVATTRRWERVSSMHASNGMAVDMCFYEGRDTQASTLVKTGQDGVWSIGGGIVEEQSRSSHACVAKAGPYHRGRYARYRWTKYVTFSTHNQAPPVYHWKETHWTGGLAKQTNSNIPVADWDPQHAEILPSGGFGTANENNHTFVGGVSLLGFTHMWVNAGYSGVTRMDWSRTSGCSNGTRYLYGNGVDITQAQVVYATCR
jgi:hypothetical protein